MKSKNLPRQEWIVNKHGAISKFMRSLSAPLKGLLYQHTLRRTTYTCQIKLHVGYSDLGAVHPLTIASLTFGVLPMPTIGMGQPAPSTWDLQL